MRQVVEAMEKANRQVAANNHILGETFHSMAAIRYGDYIAHLPAQDAYGDDRRIYADGVLSFNPWHALAAHQPLGSIMRSRRTAYPRSSDFRPGFNRVQPEEPSGIEDLPA